MRPRTSKQDIARAGIALQDHILPNSTGINFIEGTNLSRPRVQFQVPGSRFLGFLGSSRAMLQIVRDDNL